MTDKLTVVNNPWWSHSIDNRNVNGAVRSIISIQSIGRFVFIKMSGESLGIPFLIY